MAWHTAFLQAYAPEKSRNFPPLNKMLSSGKARSKASRDWQADFDAVSAWAGRKG